MKKKEIKDCITILKSMVTVAGPHCLYKAAQLHMNTHVSTTSWSKCNQRLRNSHPPSAQISLLVCLSVFLFNSSVQHVLENRHGEKGRISVFRCRRSKSVAAETEDDRVLFSKLAVLHSASYWKSCPVTTVRCGQWLWHERGGPQEDMILMLMTDDDCS